MAIQMNLFELDNEYENTLTLLDQSKVVKVDDYVKVSLYAIERANVTNDIESYYYLSSFEGKVGRVIKKHYVAKPYIEVAYKEGVALFYMDEVSVILK